jgi:hypothetical protein
MTEAQIIAVIATLWAFAMLFRSARAFLRFWGDFFAGIGLGMLEEWRRIR